jgi:hypothetical protein
MKAGPLPRMKAVMKLLALSLAALAAGCDPQLPSKVTAQADELASLKQRVGALEVNASALGQSVQKLEQAPAGNWTLWQVSEAANGGYPQALSAYSSKGDCLAAAGNWTFPDGKVVSVDPTIWQLKAYRVRRDCLPVGVNPYAH